MISSPINVSIRIDKANDYLIKRIIKIGLPVAVLALAVAANVYLRATKPNVEAQPARERVWPVAIVKADPGNETPTLHAYGTIVAGRELELKPLVGGRVIEVGEMLVDGGVVRAGETLVTIDPFDFATAIDQRRAELREARAKLVEIKADIEIESSMLERDQEQVSISQRDVQRRQTLRKKSAGSEKALDDARVILSERREAVLAREQTVTRLKARAEQQQATIDRWEAALRRDEKDLQRTKVTAPFDAFVTDVDVAVGQQVDKRDKLARLIAVDGLDVRFHLSTREFSRLAASGRFYGRSVRVLWHLGDETQEFEADIQRQQSEIDPATGGVELYARVKSTGFETLLRPGAFVEVFIPDQSYPAVVSLPNAALHADDTVYKVVEGRLEIQHVTPVMRQRGQVFVAGIAAGTLIVTSRFPEMGPGLRVSVQ